MNRTGIENRRERLKNVKDFAVYYGIGGEEKLEHYGLVIVEAKGHSTGAISRLQRNGTIVLAYVSIMQTVGEDSGAFAECDFLRIDNRLLVNEEYGSVLMDLRSETWKACLLNNISRLLQVEGYDGIFLDTVSDIENRNIPEEQRNLLLNEAVSLVRHIRGAFEDAIIIQNNGLAMLYMFTQCHIDGICWENPPVGKIIKKGCFKQTIRILEALSCKGLKILLLFEGKQKRNFGPFLAEGAHLQNLSSLAKTKGYLVYKAPFRYLGI